MDALRRSLREQRRALDDGARAAAAQAVAVQLPALLDGVANLGAYLAVAGELDPAPAVAWAWHQSIAVYVPKLTAGRSMVFVPWSAGAAHRRGQLGVPEPVVDTPVRAAGRLDAVLVPLVAFDRSGTRLGTGEGFYDRAFDFRRDQPRGSAPVLIGLAYSWQETEPLERRSWDIPLDYVVTEREVIRATG